MKTSAFLVCLVTVCTFCFPEIRADRARETASIRAADTKARLRAIQTSSVEYRPTAGEGPSVWLVSVAHLGTPEYYAAIQRRLDAKTVMLFEGVGFEDRMKNEAFGEGGAGALSGVERAEGVDDDSHRTGAGDVRVP